jgi:hypothetical protein
VGFFILKYRVAMVERFNILISIPQDFKEKFLGFINNLNMINSGKERPVIIERISLKKNPIYVAVPKELEEEEE